MIDFHVAWSIIVLCSCLLSANSRISLWGVLHRRSELLFLSFYLLVCPICIYFFSQLAILLSNSFFPRAFTILSTFISTQIFSILIALIRSAIPPAISFDLISILLLRSKSTWVFLAGSHKPCANYS